MQYLKHKEEMAETNLQNASNVLKKKIIFKINFIVSMQDRKE